MFCGDQETNQNTIASSTSDTSISSLPFDRCRLFLAHIGVVMPHLNSLLSSKTGEIKNSIGILPRNSKLERSIKHLDQSPSRETMKIAVIYVGRDQGNDQYQILRNTSGSKEYERFISCLGWEIDLGSHRGFTGGLDTNRKTLSNGSTTLYYATASLEMIFHVVTKMPNVKDDLKQVNKKRHVGNDFVHIVWTDDTKKYLANTITSNFNDVQIVIYPLKSYKGLYRIQIMTKPEIPAFGPLVSGMVVTAQNLPQLVRQTAINANRMCRMKASGFIPPYFARKQLIQEINERYSINYTDGKLLENLFAYGTQQEDTDSVSDDM